ncbi:MAG: hypothetical protein ABIO70_19385 [Pseudomonadota bacterium]
MSEDQNTVEARLGYLLLRDGHAVPLAGITPDNIKDGAKHRVPHPEAEPLRHRQTLTAIVDRLGFQGDFGDFQRSGWPSFLAYLSKNECTRRAGLFPADHGGCMDLYFHGVFAPTRRQLADRIFEAADSAPTRVFLGYGVDWGAWDGGSGYAAPEDAVATVGGDPGTARQRASQLFELRHDLVGQWGFLDDKLVAGPVEHIVDKTYWPPGSTDQQRKDSQGKVEAAVLAFRAVFDAMPEGWVDVLRYNDRLVVLRAYDGSWDLLWRAFRDEEPPQPEDVGEGHHLAVGDLPASLKSESDQRRAIHFRQQVWEEREAHEAEQAFYDRGGDAQARRLTSEADVRFAWLFEQGVIQPERVRWEGEPPPGFHAVKVAGRLLAVSDLVDVETYRRMLIETGYLDRRAPSNEPWDRANESVLDTAPVGVNWADAQAFCAWKERQIGVVVRLPRKDELRGIRPFYSERYAKLAGFDFLWENYPPRPIIEPVPGGSERRFELPSAVAWSESRHLEPGPDLPEFPSASGWSAKSRKRWSEDFPPRAPWREDLPWGEHAGLHFIDAWDAYEWCQEPGWINGRFWEGLIGVTSWGAYKNVKVAFRLVLDLKA